MINMPKFFHEILGEKQRKVELVFIILFTILATSLLFLYNHNFITSLPLFNQVLLLVLTLDITGGVVANLSYGTDQFYSKRKKARMVFIAIHFQPIIIFLAAQMPLWIALTLWAYTIFCALVLEIIKHHPSQKIFAGFDFCVGLLILFAFQNSLPPYLMLMMIFFCFKVIYSFSVTHHTGEDHE